MGGKKKDKNIMSIFTVRFAQSHVLQNDDFFPQKVSRCRKITSRPLCVKFFARYAYKRSILYPKRRMLFTLFWVPIAHPILICTVYTLGIKSRPSMTEAVKNCASPNTTVEVLR